MYVVVVDFEIHPNHIEMFGIHMRENAATSLNSEPGCLQFDVCSDLTNPSALLLYEVYVSREAFDEHLRSEHFLRFNDVVTPWVVSKRVRTFTRSHPKP